MGRDEEVLQEVSLDNGILLIVSSERQYRFRTIDDGVSGTLAEHFELVWESELEHRPQISEREGE